MVPVMLGCGVQEYGNVPTLSNVRLNVPPAAIFPESQTLESLVIEWIAPPSVHLIVSPTLIVASAVGLKCHTKAVV
jgi:hypothetical protein